MPKRIVIVDDNRSKRRDIKDVILEIASRCRADVTFTEFNDDIEFKAFLATNPQDIAAVFVDNEIHYVGHLPDDKGVEMMIAARQALPEVPLFWSSAHPPSAMESADLKRAAVEFIDANGFGGFKSNAVELLDMFGALIGDDRYKHYTPLVALEQLLTREKGKSALDMARRGSGQVSFAEQADRPSTGFSGVNK